VHDNKRLLSPNTLARFDEISAKLLVSTQCDQRLLIGDADP
jgi:hypothetical protein